VAEGIVYHAQERPERSPPPGKWPVSGWGVAGSNHYLTERMPLAALIMNHRVIGIFATTGPFRPHCPMRPIPAALGGRTAPAWAGLGTYARSFRRLRRACGYACDAWLRYVARVATGNVQIASVVIVG
jgi:hypothetical protein